MQLAAITLSLAVCVGLFSYAWAGRAIYDSNGPGITYETARVLGVLANNAVVGPTVENVCQSAKPAAL